MTTLTAEKTLPLKVDNVGFLLDRLGEDCHPLQFLRELTQNSIEALLKTPEQEGEIVWDVDWASYDLGDHGVFKLCITDNGCGMSGEEMLRYINQLSSSGAVQSTSGNYGVGAKVAAATRNHNGLVYLSWKSGLGAMIHLWRDPATGQYGLREFEQDGSYDHWAEIDDDIKPDIVAKHGTKIILMGNALDQDTMKAPPEASSPSAWIAKYLNGRYFRIPKKITIRARQGWEQPRENTDVNLLRTVTGQRPYLENHAQAAGCLPLSGAKAHWWILKDEKALSSNSGYIESSGHIAALYGDELYELASGRSGHAKLQQFGIIFGHRQVVIYVEPDATGTARLTTNTARTDLLIDSQPLPWSEWAAEFRAKLPDEIEAHMQAIAAKSKGTDHSKSIRERLKNMLDLFKVSRYRPTPDGSLRIGDPVASAVGSARPREEGSTRRGAGGGTPAGGGTVGGIYSAFLKKDGTTGREARPDLFPRVTWVSLDEGTRDQGDIEDKAARYLEDQNHLLINGDFRAFTDMVKHWVTSYSKSGSKAGIKELATESVHGWFEQALVETIIGLQALRGSKEWPIDHLRTAWSEEALTSVVMQRYHPFNSVKRELGTKIASLKA